MSINPVSKAGTYQAQQGTVLIIVVFVVVVITAISTRFTHDYQLAIARAGQTFMHTRLQQAIYSVESYGASVLIADAKRDNDDGKYTQGGIGGSYDYMGEDWQNPLQAPIDEITVEASIEDALSRFNINQLAGRPTPYNPNGPFAERYTTAQKRFMRLLQTQPDDLVDTALAQQITESVIDWIDEDSSITGSGGAESDFYLSQEQPTRAANRFIVSITELRQIQGITPEIYEYLEPLLIALPDNSGININTAPLAIMRSLNQTETETPLTEDEANTLMSRRPLSKEQQAEQASQGGVPNNDTQVFETVDDFFNSNEFAQVFGNDVELWPSTDGLRTGSEYFILTTQVSMLEYEREQRSLLRRKMADDGPQTAVIRRTRGQL